MKDIGELVPGLQEKPENGVLRITTGGFKGSLDPEIVSAANEGRVGFVYQRGMGFLDGNQVNDGLRYLETSDFSGTLPGFGPCVSLVAWSPETNNTFMVHIDSLTNLEEVRRMLDELLDESAEISLVGGRTNTSELTVERIVEHLKGRQFSKLRYDLFGAQLRQVVVDGATGEVFVLYSEAKTNLKKWDFYPPEEIQTRAGIISHQQESLAVDVTASKQERPIS